MDFERNLLRHCQCQYWRQFRVPLSTNMEEEMFAQYTPSIYTNFDQSENNKVALIG